MTEKQENILSAALELFAEEGFKATSTSRVAKKANVSEGLIFRHFKNKEGLLEAIIQKGEEKAKLMFADIVLETEPKEVLRKTFQIKDAMAGDEKEGAFWKLQYKLKWELERYGENKMESLKVALRNAFNKLGYEEPEEEAVNLMVLIDGLATRFYLQEGFNIDSQIEFLYRKYNI
ncbi:TetR/AcrR family transcriptional regulator [Reichenbachiella versicolor]|uniref:TetR/AcrR family transcriptional regulator n=1 Tax=Reichenbachiella versicolor TaxID=1821036 RepID=UPI000D6EA927|nr:helix-turn-helix domain-containing protein [Reichenbachiella versicolor]